MEIYRKKFREQQQRSFGESIGLPPEEAATILSDAEKARNQRGHAKHAAKLKTLLTAEQQAAAVSDITAIIESEKKEPQTACKELVKKYGVNYRTLKRYYDKSLKQSKRTTI